MLTRITIIAAIILLAIGMATAGTQGFFFVQMADPQFGMSRGKDITPEVENFRKAVVEVNRLKPAFVVISGDFANQPHDPAQIRAFWNIVHEIDPSIPVHLVPGNHDLGTSTDSAVRFYDRVFGPDRYQFSYGGSEFIVLDTTIICDPGPDPKLRDVQRKWFEEALGSARKKNPDHIFVLTHHPWFVTSPTEKDDYFNVPTSQRKDYLSLMDRFGADYGLAGHLHKESIGNFGRFTMITTSSVGKALGSDPVGFRIVHVYPSRVEQAYYPLSL